MTEIVPVVFSVVLVILTVVLSVVGIQLVMVLAELRRTLQRVNNTIDIAESKLNSVVQPFQNLGGMASGLTTGFKVFESFVGWLNRNNEK
jgi:uncharacterized protein YoxC